MSDYNLKAKRVLLEERAINLLDLRHGNLLTDVSIVCNGKEYPVHKLVIISACPYLETLFNTGKLESTKGKINLNISEIPDHVFQVVVDFMYTGNVDVTHWDDVKLEGLLFTSHFLRLDVLYLLCWDHLERKCMTTDKVKHLCKLAKSYNNKAVHDRAVNFVAQKLYDSNTKQISPRSSSLLSSDSFTSTFGDFLFKAESQLPPFVSPRRELCETFSSMLEQPKFEGMKQQSTVSVRIDANIINMSQFAFRANSTSDGMVNSYLEEQENYVQTLRIEKSADSTRRIKTHGRHTISSTQQRFGDVSNKPEKKSAPGNLDIALSPRSSCLAMISQAPTLEMICFGSHDFTRNTVSVFKFTDRLWLLGRTAGFVLEKGMGNVSVSRNVYFLGGGSSPQTASSRAIEYNIPYNTHKLLNPMGVRRYSPGAAAFNGYIYVIGGQSRNSTPLNRVECYNIFEDRWNFRSNTICLHTAPNVIYLNGNVYVVGSFRNEVVEHYNVDKDQWTIVTKIPAFQTKYGIPVAVSWGYRIFVWMADSQAYIVYNPDTNIWNSYFKKTYDFDCIYTVSTPEYSLPFIVGAKSDIFGPVSLFFPEYNESVPVCSYEYSLPFNWWQSVLTA